MSADKQNPNSKNKVPPLRPAAKINSAPLDQKAPPKVPLPPRTRPLTAPIKAYVPPPIPESQPGPDNTKSALNSVENDPLDKTDVDFKVDKQEFSDGIQETGAVEPLPPIEPSPTMMISLDDAIDDTSGLSRIEKKPPPAVKRPPPLPPRAEKSVVRPLPKPTVAKTPSRVPVEIAARELPPIALDTPNMSTGGFKLSEDYFRREIEFFTQEATSQESDQPHHAALSHLRAALHAYVADERESIVVENLDRALQQAQSRYELVHGARRLFTWLKQDRRALTLCEQEAANAPTERHRADALVDAATIQTFRLKDTKQALRALEQAHMLSPGRIDILLPLLLLQLELKQYAPAAQSFELLSECVHEPSLKAQCLYNAASLTEAFLDNSQTALQHYVRAFEVDPTYLPASIALSSLYQQRAQWDAYAQSLTHLAKELSDPKLCGHCWLEAGIAYLDRTGNLSAAEAALKQAAGCLTHDTTPLERLVLVQEQKGEPLALTRTMLDLLNLVEDKRSRAVLQQRLGELWLAQGIKDKARDAFQGALRDQPGYLPAIQQLGSMFRAEHDYAALYLLYAGEAESSHRDPVRAAWCVEVAEILSEHLANLGEAISAYQRALEIMPQLSLAFFRLRQLLKQHQREPQLASLLAQQISQTTDPQTRYHLSLELARLQADALDEPIRAVEILDRVQGSHPTRSAMWELIDLAYRNKTYDKLPALLLTEAQHTSDRFEEIGRRFEAAFIYEHHLDEPEQALAQYQTILKLDPDHSVAMKAAGRLLHRLHRWDALIALHQHELESQQDRTESAVILTRIGQIWASKLNQTDKAIQHFEKALTLDASYQPALFALESVARRENRWNVLLSALEHSAREKREPYEKASVLCRAAEILDAQLGQEEQAFSHYRHALATCRDHERARFGLTHAALRKKEWQAALEALSVEEDSKKSSDHLWYTQIMSGRLKEISLHDADSISDYERANRQAHRSGLLDLELLRLYQLYRPERITSWTATIGESVRDAALKSALLLESTQRQLAAVEHDASSVLSTILKAYECDPNSHGVKNGLEQVLMNQRDWHALGALWHKAAEGESAAASRKVICSQAALAFLKTGDTHRATLSMALCSTNDEPDIHTLRLQALFAEQQHNWTGLALLQDQLARVAKHPQNQLGALLKAAECWQRVEAPSRALASLMTALELQPNHWDAFTQAQALLLAEGNYVELSKLYHSRIKVCDNAQERIELLRQHATLLRDHLLDDNGAIKALMALLGFAPNDLEALMELAQLQQKLNRWTDASTTLQRIISTTDDVAIRMDARLSLAKIWIEPLNMPESARDLLGAALKDQPQSIPTKKLLIELFMGTGEWSDAQALLQHLVRETDLSTRYWAWRKLLNVAKRGLRDNALAETCELEMLRTAATDVRLLSKHIAHYREEHEWQKAISLCEHLLAQAPTAPGMDALRLELAELLLDDADQPVRAMEHLRPFLASDKNHVPALILCGRALERIDQDETALDAYRRVLSESLDNVPAYRGLTRLMEKIRRPELATSAACLVDLFGSVEPEEALLIQTLEGVATPRGTFDVLSLPLSSRFREVYEILLTAFPYLGSIYPSTEGRELERHSSAASACAHLARAFGVEELKVVTTASAGARAGIGAPFQIYISEGLLKKTDTSLFRFWIGRALAEALTASALLHRCSDNELDQLLEALCLAKPIEADTQQLRKQIGRELPRKVRKQLENHALPSTKHQFWSEYRSAEQRRADYIGLLLSRNPKVAVQEIAQLSQISPTQYLQSERLTALITGSMSDAFRMHSHTLWGVAAR